MEGWSQPRLLFLGPCVLQSGAQRATAFFIQPHPRQMGIFLPDEQFRMNSIATPRRNKGRALLFGFAGRCFGASLIMMLDDLSSG